jgi:L-cystine transport system substrate-binding protein
MTAIYNGADMIKGKKLLAVSGLLILGILAAACSKNKETEETSSNNNSDAKTIVVGTGSSYEPYCYLDEKGKLTGYEIAVLNAVDDLLPQYKFDIQIFEFKNIAVGIDAGQIDLGAHQFEENDERREKYLFSEESYTIYDNYVAVAIDREDIDGIDDLAGKKVKASTGGNNVAYNLEKYNEEHTEAPLDIVYSSETTEQLISNLENGTYDGTVLLDRNVERYNEQYGERLKIVGEPFTKSNTYYLYPKGKEELQKAVDGALKQLKEDGTLAKLSIEYIGKDYTPKAE